MALTVSYAAHSEVGLVRTNNQDSAYVSPTMLMVADGMGGAAAGDLASAVATWELERTDQHLAERLAAAHAERATSGEPAAEDGAVEDIITVMRSTLHRANDRLIQLVEDDPHLDGMGTTVCGFVLADDTMAVVNIGDSRAYRVRDGSRPASPGITAGCRPSWMKVASPKKKPSPIRTETSSCGSSTVQTSMSPTWKASR